MIKIIEFDKDKYPFDKMVSELYDIPLSTLNDNLDHTGGDLGMDIGYNLVHGSDGVDTAEFELGLW